MEFCPISSDFDFGNFAKIAITLGRGPGPAPPKILLTHFVSFKNLKLEITNFTAKKDLIESNKYSRFCIDLKMLFFLLRSEICMRKVPNFLLLFFILLHLTKICTFHITI